jgi:S-adenosylmethionine hydrolase
MKGVVLAGCPHAVLVDVSHEVPLHSRRALMLFAARATSAPGPCTSWWSIPGRQRPSAPGLRRRPLLRRPDNGLFAIVIEEVGLQKGGAAPRSGGAPTFEGRDVCSGGGSACGGVPLRVARPPDRPSADARPHPPCFGDGFGNLVTNVAAGAQDAIHNHDITATTTTEARANEPFVYVGSMGYLEVGVRESRADRLLGARAGMPVELI